MHEFREFLVPIDFSEPSLLALAPAYTMAKLAGGKVFLLHVIDLPGVANPIYGHYTPGAALTPDARAKLEAGLADRLRTIIPRDPEYASVPTEVRVRSHVTPADAIVEEAAAVGADVIFLAHKGWSTIKHLLVGSTAERVIKYAPCPVMVMRVKS